MTLLEMKNKVLQLIEEIGTGTELTDDPDIEAKLNTVINQIQNELSRMRKIPDYIELEVNEGDLITFKDLKSETKNDVYQINIIRGVDYDLKADGTIIKCLEDGLAEIEYYRYPKTITDATEDSYTFELSNDVLEIMPYGVAADLLKSDVSSGYGQIYAQRYETMLQRLDPRYSMSSVYIEGGIEV